MSRLRIAIVHGYFLGDSGSAVYVRELAREYVRQGHDVTLVCQEQQSQDYDFIDAVFECSNDNRELECRFERETDLPGSCRLVRPNLNGTLLTYVAGPFPGYKAVPFQEAADSQVESYLDHNIRALETIFTQWTPDFVQANHLLMQPFVVLKTLMDEVPYITTIHGSALNFTVKTDDRMVPYALDGLKGAKVVGALSETSCDDVIEFARSIGLEVAGKTVQLPPGVDSGLMKPALPGERAEVLRRLSAEINAEQDDVAIFAGRILWTKGLQYVVTAMPLILQARPGFRLVVVGEGPMEAPLRMLIDLLDDGDLDRARILVNEHPELRSGDEYGPVFPGLGPEEEIAYIESARRNIRHRVHFTGHLTHSRLAPLYAVADISLAVSVFPEAFALVSIEALSAGAIPIVTYQTGLKAAADFVARELEDSALRQLFPGGALTVGLAQAVTEVLDRYPTRDYDFRQRLHELADDAFSWSKLAVRYTDLALP